MQVLNVTTVGQDAVQKTIKVQFDLSWENSWRDDINYDAAWVFIKYKDTDGLWKHGTLQQEGSATGTGTTSTVDVTEDGVGSFIFRSQKDTGDFSIKSAHLTWNYGINGVPDPAGLEIRVFAIEMVYIPEGYFSMDNYLNMVNYFDETDEWKNTDICLSVEHGLIDKYKFHNCNIDYHFYIEDGKPVDYCNDWENNCTMKYNYISFKVKGGFGADSSPYYEENINPDYPEAYNAYYVFKYEVSTAQIDDFYNTLTYNQRDSIKIIRSYGNSPNNAYVSNYNFSYDYDWNKYLDNDLKYTNAKLLAYADWAGLRPQTIFELYKSINGPTKINYGSTPVNENRTASSSFLTGGKYGTEYGYVTNDSYVPYSNEPSRVGMFARANTSRGQSGASYYGVMDLMGNVTEPVILTDFAFVGEHGDGSIGEYGLSDVNTWDESSIYYFDYNINYNYRHPNDQYVEDAIPCGIRLVRTAK